MPNVPLKVAGFSIEDSCKLQIMDGDDKDVIILGIYTSKVVEILLNTWAICIGWYRKITIAFSRLH